jgi:hypothetical protein
MLRQHQGRLEEAAELFEQARFQARREGDAMGEFQALEHIVVLRQQQRAWEEAQRLSVDLDALGAKLRGGSEAPFARALSALTRQALGDPEAAVAIDAALDELRTVDAKLRLVYTLTRTARLDLERGDARSARQRAEEAHRTAGVLGRPSEVLLARLTLERACRELGDEAEATRLRRELREAPLTGVAASVRRELEELIEQAGAGATGAGSSGEANRP